MGQGQGDQKKAGPVAEPALTISLFILTALAAYIRQDLYLDVKCSGIVVQVTLIDTEK
jgi:hypothetical protein